jgi:hypothetical protein
LANFQLEAWWHEKSNVGNFIRIEFDDCFLAYGIGGVELASDSRTGSEVRQGFAAGFAALGIQQGC